MKVAVTGSSGLIGAALVAALRADGHQVIRLVRTAPAAADAVVWDPRADRGDLDPRSLDGVAVALDWGLIVPVIKKADERNLLGLSRAVVDLANRARSKQLKPDEVQGGTFTITNPGVFGALFGTPIINQPQVAILGIGAVEKRPVVVNDELVIRTMSYLTLGFDHRLIDGFAADEFMADLKRRIEHFDPASL